MTGLLSTEMPYPPNINHLRFCTLSEYQPEKTFRMLAVDSATPSIRPMTDLLTPRTLERNSGTSG